MDFSRCPLYGITRKRDLNELLKIKVHNKNQYNKKYKPYENTGISEGDTIIKIDDMQINSTDDLVNSVNKSNGQNIKINYIHNEESKECSITPIETSKKEYKIGKNYKF